MAEDSRYDSRPADTSRQEYLIRRASGGSGGFFRSFFVRAQDIPKYAKSISDIGIDFSVIGRKQRIGLSRTESEDDNSIYGVLGQGNSNIADKSVPYFDMNYKEKIDILRDFATHPEIEFILETIADEMITYNENGYFCNVLLKNYTANTEDLKKLSTDVEAVFKNIYTTLGFNDGSKPTELAVQFLIEGTLMFEKIFDDKDEPKRLVNVQELQPDTMIPFDVEEILVDDDTGKQKLDNNGEPITRIRKIWKQVIQGQEDRIIPDEAIIYISYNKLPGNSRRISYLERLLRTFNIKRTMENTNVAWYVMNAQWRTKIGVPVGDKPAAKVKQIVNAIENEYKEDIYVDNFSGEISVMGQTHINYGRTMTYPKRGGDSIEIEQIKGEGPNLGDMESVKYHERNFQRDSRLPFSRFDKENGRGNRILFGSDGIPFDEESFHKFIARLRKEWQKIIIEPIYTSMILKHKALKIDASFKTSLVCQFENNSYFELAKQYETYKFKLQAISEFESLTDEEGQALFPKEWLYVQKFALLTKSEWDSISQMKLSKKGSSTGDEPSGDEISATGDDLDF